MNEIEPTEKSIGQEAIEQRSLTMEDGRERGIINQPDEPKGTDERPTGPDDGDLLG